MSDLSEEIVGRGTREGSRLFREWFAELAEHERQGRPIAYVFVDALIYGYRVNHPEADQTFLNSLSWMLPFAINGGLCFGDERQLALAGHNTKNLQILAVLLAPVYLFVRAKRVKQTPIYGYAWIGSFVAAAILAML